MRIKATLKIIIKTMCAAWKQVLLMYVIFPLLLTTVMGYMQKEEYKPEASFKKINVNIVDKDNSESSKNFKDMFYSDSMKKIFNVNSKGKFIITIPKDYENNLINLKENTIYVNDKNNESGTNETIIKTVINEYGKSVSESVIIADKIKKLNIKDKEKVYKDISDKLYKGSSEAAIKTNMLKGERVLSSFENEASSIITYILFMIILSCFASHDLDKKNGTFKRMISTPISRFTYFNINMLIFFVSSIIYGLLYIITMRVAGYAFKDTNPFLILLILIGQSLLASSVAGFLTAYFKKQVANFVVIILMYFDIIFGGAFIPVKEFSSKALMSLSNYTPGKVISSAYKDLILFNSFNKIIFYVLIMVMISAIVYFLSLIKVRIRWEE